MEADPPTVLRHFEEELHLLLKKRYPQHTPRDILIQAVEDDGLWHVRVTTTRYQLLDYQGATLNEVLPRIRAFFKKILQIENN